MTNDATTAMNADFERVFEADVAKRPRSPAKSAFYAILIGCVVGLAGWIIADRHVSVSHLSLWLGINSAWVVVVVLLDRRNPILQLRVTPDSLTIVRKKASQTHRWRDIEAARFQVYPIISIGQSVECFLFRSGGKNTELLTGLDSSDDLEFHDLVMQLLVDYDIPPDIDAMPAFDYLLSQTGGWLFALSAIGMLAAHAAGVPTLATLIGLTLLVTSAVLALISRKHRLSKLVIVCAIVLFGGGWLIIRLCNVDLQRVLQGWEQRERDLGRPAWMSLRPDDSPAAKNPPQESKGP